MTHPLNVAVIGAGICGLLTTRELLREKQQVTVFEKSDKVGGTWVYDPRVEAEDLLGLDPNRSIVHSSLYSSLRTNLPRPLMSFSDFSFEDKFYGDPRMFPGHEEVQKFLEHFAKEFGVSEVIRFNSEVVRVDFKNDGFVVEWSTIEAGLKDEVFDAVVVCNGHHTEPRVADDIPGIKEWSRKQLHSHNYRVPEPFRDQVVVVIGNGPSARDISKDIAKVAREVHLASRSSDVKVSKVDGYENMWQHLKITRVFDNGTVVFQDGDSIEADTILHCTGYKYHFPFLRTNDLVHVDNNRVDPLYKHVFPPQLAPRLAFVGLTFNQRLIFPILELQSKWAALVISGKILLPSEDNMLAEVHEHYRELDENGFPKSLTHSLWHKVIISIFVVTLHIFSNIY
ncbi:flavin monooxygenase-like, FAD/NAD(P)-binding domain protein [Artemisia annua]|uniref:Flavin-containing monooxygenase n=1 Tax=Artemisia annua TaxID=35608 RepID=A0A2U1LA54_ARTAN|nr:flavin monooxygenase-like, FAD/NAD(P)-binding domain protein [Artemisia annua]